MGSEAKKPKPCRGQAWGILNPYGDLWGHETFSTPEAAMRRVADFWRGIRTAPDLSKFKPVRVRVTISVLPSAHPTPGDSPCK